MKFLTNIIHLLHLFSTFSIISIHSRNILLVTTDDMNSAVFDNYGQNDNIIKHSFFDSANIFNAITPIAVCGPARASLLTGLRPDTTKKYNFESYLYEETIFSYFKKMGYDTFVTGKVFHTLPEDKNKQFEYKIGALTSPRVCLEAGNSGCKQNAFYCNIKNSEDSCSIKNTIQFFKSRVDKKTNWIAGVGFHRPHLLLSLTSKNTELCKKYIKNLPTYKVPIIHQDKISINFDYSLSNIQSTDFGYIKVPIGKALVKIASGGRKYPSDLFVNRYNPTIKKMRQAYCISTTETINNFLKLVDSLYNILPQSINDTDIIFISDHGFQIGERGILGKNTLYPEATNIPLFFKIAGENKPRKLPYKYVSSIDVFPTLIELHFPKLITNIKLNGVSLFKNGQIPISQYPRCQSIDNIQTNECTKGDKQCSRPKLTYMGYMTIGEINGITYRFSEWFKYVEFRTCEWPFWKGMPSELVNRLGSYPVWNLQESSYTDFSNSYHQELYTIDKNGLVNSTNLAILYDNNEIKNAIRKLDQIIKFYNNK